MRRGRFRSLIACAAALLLGIAAAALAATGDLTPQGCVDDDDSGADACAQATDGLDLATAITVSPDGSSVYAGSGSDHAIVHFSRNPTSGALTPQGCVDDNDTGVDGCAQTTDALAGTFSVAVSPDGNSVYATGTDDAAVVRLDRDPATGALTPRGCLDDNDTGGEMDCSDTSGLAAVRSVAVSPDGRSIYAAGRLDDAIVRIDRDPSTGAFADNACIDDGDAGQGPDECGPGNVADGLGGASGVAVSADGASVYVASFADDAISIFNRAAGTGVLTPVGCIDDNDPGQGEDTCGQSTDGLHGAFSVAVSPDGQSVYATSLRDDAVVRFDRDTGSGMLTPAGCVDDNDFASDPDQGPDDCAQSTDGLAEAASVAVSSDGRSVYVAGASDRALVVFDRSLNPGALTPRGCIDDNDTGPDDCAQSTDGLEIPAAVAISPDDASVYTAAQGDDAVAAFARERPDTDPPETTITKGPKRKTKKRRAKLKFTSDEPGSTFQCKLDKKPFKPCQSPRRYRKKKIDPGKHKFKVQATDPAGNTDPTPAKRKWRVKPR